MKIQDFLQIIDSDFFVGVPDSLLRSLCDFLYIKYGVSKNHIVAANEGNAVAIATGYYLATGKVPVVYMQNSGIGNAVNPVLSLTHSRICGIPCVFLVGWRGEPGIHDEPQHVVQGEKTISLLEEIGIETTILDEYMTIQKLRAEFELLKFKLSEGKSVAIVIKEGVLTFQEKVNYCNSNELVRENVIERIVEYAGKDIIISTTGKASRELFEIRQCRKEVHDRDFLTVGSMGHSSSIALGLALYTNKRIWCIDGDGAALMHMGAMAVIGASKPNNLIHIIINNGAHESVGGIPTVAQQETIDFTRIAVACGYENAISVSDYNELEKALSDVSQSQQLSFIEVKCKIESRKNLGRPSSTPKKNVADIMEILRKFTYESCRYEEK